MMTDYPDPRGGAIDAQLATDLLQCRARPRRWHPLHDDVRLSLRQRVEARLEVVPDDGRFNALHQDAAVRASVQTPPHQGSLRSNERSHRRFVDLDAGRLLRRALFQARLFGCRCRRIRGRGRLIAGPSALTQQGPGREHARDQHEGADGSKEKRAAEPSRRVGCRGGSRPARRGRAFHGRRPAREAARHGICEFEARGVAASRLGGQCHAHALGRCPVEPLHVFAQGGEDPALLGDGELDGAFSLERQLARQRFVHGDGERVLVGLAVHVPAERLLGCHVGR